MHIWFDGENLHIDNDDSDMKIFSVSNPYEVNHNIHSDCKPCDRCHNRQDGHTKILPIRPESLCPDCKRKLELLAYITEEN